MDTDAAMEFDNLNVAPRDAPPRGPARELTTPDLVNCLTQGMANTAAELLEKFTWLPPVSAAADTGLSERFQQRRAMALQPPAPKSTATVRVSAFDRLEHRKQSPQKEEAWAPHPEMTPMKVERGRQLDRGQESYSKSVGQSEQGSGWPASQKRCSQSRPWGEMDSKKGQTECEVQVGIDWANTGIQKPIPKPNP